MDDLPLRRLLCGLASPARNSHKLSGERRLSPEAADPSDDCRA